MTTGIVPFDCFIAGMIGILCHVLFLKLPALKSRADAAGESLSIKEYLKNDWIGLAASFVSVIAFIFILDEVLAYKPEVSKWLKFSFLFIGYTGSSILQGIFNKTDKKIQQINQNKL